MASSQGAAPSSLPQKPDVSTPPPAETRPPFSPESARRPTAAPMAVPPPHFNARERDVDRDRDRERDRPRDVGRDGYRGNDWRDDRDRDRGGRSYGAPPPRRYSPLRRDCDRKPNVYHDRRRSRESSPRGSRSRYSPPRPTASRGRPQFDSRRGGRRDDHYSRSDYDSRRPYVPRNRAPSPNDWRSGQRRTPPPSYSSHRARSPRGRYSPSPSKRSRSPRRVSPLPRRSRSRSPVRRRTPNPTRRVSRSSSRSARGPSRSRSPDKKAKPHLLPPIGAPTGPRAQLNRAPASPPYIPTRHTPPPRQREPCIPPVQPPAREIHDEVQLTASGTELDVGLKDEPMEVDSTKEEGQLASVPASPRHPPSVSTSHNMAPLPTGPSFASRNPPSAFAPPADGNRLTAQPPISRLDSSRQSTADAVKHEPRKAEIPQERPQVKKSRWDTREDGWGVNNAEASSPMNRAHGVSPQHKPTHGKSSPYTHHVKDSPSSPRPPLKQGDRPPVQDYLKPSTSSAPTPLIPVKDLGTSSATHSPRPPYPPHQPERTVSGDPSHAIRPAARHGPEATSRSYIHTRNTEKDKLPTIYGELSLELHTTWQARMLAEKSYWTLSHKLYSDVHELDIAMLDLRSTQSRRKIAEGMLDKAKMGMLGIDYPSPASLQDDEVGGDAVMN